MKTKIYLYLVIISLIALAACEKERPFIDDTSSPGYKYTVKLSHTIDTSQKTYIVDNMLSYLEVDSTSNGIAVAVLYKNTCSPYVNASTAVSRTDYSVSNSLLSLLPLATNISASTEEAYYSGPNHKASLQLITQSYPDGQVVTIEVRNTRHWVVVSGKKYWFPSLKLQDCKFEYMQSKELYRVNGENLVITYSSEYKNNLLFVPTDCDDNKIITIPIFAYATRSVILPREPQKEIKQWAENKKWSPIDSLSSRVEFDRVALLENKDTVRAHKSQILYHWIRGNNARSKYTSSFAYQKAGLGTTQSGKAPQEATRKVTDDLGVWNIFGIYGTYENTFKNGIAADTIKTHYDSYIEYATYTEAQTGLTVRFPRQAMNIVEANSVLHERTSDKSGYDMAVFENRVKATYLALPQTAGETVYLYKTK